MKKFLVFSLILALLCQSMVFSYEKFADIEGHWAETTIEKWFERSLINGYPDGTFRPNKPITRAEFVTILNSIYGYYFSEDKYSDVKENEWFFDSANIAKSNGYMTWLQTSNFNGNQVITREEVCAILYHVMQLEPVDTRAVLTIFKDEFSVWSKDYIAALVSEGYLSGYPDKTFRGKDTITRAESLVMLDRVIGNLFNVSGSYGSSVKTYYDNNVTVTQPNITLSNMEIMGDLILSAGIGQGTVTLDQVTVLGRTIINGGGLNSIIIKNSNLNDVIVIKYGSGIRLVSETSLIESIIQHSSGILFGDYSGTLLILKSGESFTLDGDFKKVVIDTSIKMEITSDSVVSSLIVNKAANIFGEGSVVEASIFDEDAIVDVAVDDYVDGFLVFEEEETPAGSIIPIQNPPPSPPPPNPNPTPTNQAPVNNILPSVSGDYIVGQELQADKGSWSDDSTNNLTYSYAWILSSSSSGIGTIVATNTSYNIIDTDIDKYIKLQVSASDGDNATTTVETTYVKINKIPNQGPVNDVLPSVTGQHIVGQTLQGDIGSWSDDYTDSLNYSYLWLLSANENDQGIEVGSNADYMIKDIDVDQYIKLRVIASDDDHATTIAETTYVKINRIPNQGPVNDVLPSVIGDYIVGQTLKADLGSWSDDYTDLLNYSYSWIISASESGQGAVVESNVDYILKDTDVDKYIKLQVSASDGDHATTIAETTYVKINRIPNQGPVNDVLPSVIGDYIVGQTLKADIGSWSDDYTDLLNYSYSWIISASESGQGAVVESNVDYILKDTDVDKYIKLQVSASDGDHATTTAESNYVKINRIPNQGPVNDVLPSVIGDYIVGQTLQADIGSWSDDYTDLLNYSYSWIISASESGQGAVVESNVDYILKDTDVDKYIKLQVSASDGDHATTTAESNYVKINRIPNQGPVNDVLPSVIGDYIVGQTLQADIGSWSDDYTDLLNYSYSWIISASESGQGAVVESNVDYILKDTDVDKYIKLQVSASDGDHATTTAESNYVKINRIPNQGPVNDVLPSVIGDYIVGQTLQADIGSWSDDYTDLLNYSYSWIISASESGQGAVVESNVDYILKDTDVDKYIKLQVSASDGDHATTIAESNYVKINRIPNQGPVNDVLPSVIGDYIVGQTLKADIGSWSDDYTDLLNYSYSWIISASESGQGAVVESNVDYILKDTDVDKYIKLQVSASDGDHATTIAETTYVLITERVNLPPENISFPSILGSLEENQIISANVGTWIDDHTEELDISYTWYFNDEENDDSILQTVSNETFSIPRLWDSRYVKLVVIAEDEDGEVTELSTNWEVINWQLDYTALGDSISKGYVLPPLVGGDSETPYVDYLAEYLPTLYPGSTVEKNQNSLEGDEVSHLLNKLTQGHVEYDNVINSEVITVCIGGNNIMNAAAYQLPLIGITVYDFRNVNEDVANQGLESFNTDFPLLVTRLKELNPQAELILMTVYNPYNSNDEGKSFSEMSGSKIETNVFMHEFTDRYLKKGVNGNIGMNQMILNLSPGNYKVADVYDGFLSYAQENNMGTYTHLYDGETGPLGIELDNPHPTQQGQLQLYEIHKNLLE